MVCVRSHDRAEQALLTMLKLQRMVGGRVNVYVADEELQHYSNIFGGHSASLCSGAIGATGQVEAMIDVGTQHVASGAQGLIRPVRFRFLTPIPLHAVLHNILLFLISLSFFTLGWRLGPHPFFRAVVCLYSVTNS